MAFDFADGPALRPVKPMQVVDLFGVEHLVPLCGRIDGHTSRVLFASLRPASRPKGRIRRNRSYQEGTVPEKWLYDPRMPGTATVKTDLSLELLSKPGCKHGSRLRARASGDVAFPQRRRQRSRLGEYCCCTTWAAAFGKFQVEVILPCTACVKPSGPLPRADQKPSPF